MKDRKLGLAVDAIRAVAELGGIKADRIEQGVDVMSGARKAVPFTDHKSEMERPFTRAEVALLLGKSTQTVDRLARNGVLQRIDGGRGRAIAFTAESVNRLMKGGVA